MCKIKLKSELNFLKLNLKIYLEEKNMETFHCVPKALVNGLGWLADSKNFCRRSLILDYN